MILYRHVQKALLKRDVCITVKNTVICESKKYSPHAFCRIFLRLHMVHERCNTPKGQTAAVRTPPRINQMVYRARGPVAHKKEMSSLWAWPIEPSYISERLERRRQNVGSAGCHWLCEWSPNKRCWANFINLTCSCSGALTSTVLCLDTIE